jgi:hypothetical protein
VRLGVGVWRRALVVRVLMRRVCMMWGVVGYRIV